MIIAPIVTEFSKYFFTNVIVPKIDEIKKYFKNTSLNDDEIKNILEESILRYLVRTNAYLEILDGLVADISQIELKQVYIPISLRDSTRNEEITISLDRKLNFEAKRNRILVLGEGGAGKSTLLKIIGLQVIGTMQLCPILVSLRNLAPNHTLLDEIFSQFTELGETTEKELILKLLEGGRFLIMLDAADEVSAKDKSIIFKDVKEFIKKASKNTFIISSRQDRILSAFSDFYRYTVIEMLQDEIQLLYEKYDEITRRKISKRLMKAIKENNFDSIITNPIIATMMYNVYYHDNKLPTKNTELINRIFDIYLYELDYRKCGYTRSVVNEMTFKHVVGVFAHIAFNSLKKGTPKLAVFELEKIIGDYIEENELENKVLDVLNELVISFPLFRKEGSDYIWQHKIFEDFFAAKYILQSEINQQIVVKLYKSEKRTKYLAIFKFLAQLDKDFFVKNVASLVIRDYLNYCESTYSGFGLLEKIVVELRRSITFGIEVEIMTVKKSDDGGVSIAASQLKILANQKFSYFQAGIAKNKGFVIMISLNFEAELLDLIFSLDLRLFDDFRSIAIEPTLAFTDGTTVSSSGIAEGYKANRKVLDRLNLQDIEINMKLPEFELIKLTDDPLNPYNDIEIFHLINFFIGSHLPSYNFRTRPETIYFLNPEKCQKFLETLANSEENSILSGL